MTTNLPAMGAMLLGGSYYGLIVRGGLVFAVTASKIYSGRIFAHIIVHPFGKRCFQNICVTFYKWDENLGSKAIKSTQITIIEAILCAKSRSTQLIACFVSFYQRRKEIAGNALIL